MEEQNRVVRCYSEDTERPYFQIRYRLSLTGRELLADALNGPNSIPRSERTNSVCTTIPENNKYQTDGDYDAMMGDDTEHKTNSRVQRSRSLEGPSDNSHVAELNIFSSQIPSTPRSNNRKSQQKQFVIEDNGMEVDDAEGHDTHFRRSKSAGTAAELQMNRGAPAIPVDTLIGQNAQYKGLQEIYPQFASEFNGQVTCLNSKNVSKYRIGQTYRKGVIIGIDEDQGKIIVFQKNMPVGTLVVMRTAEPKRYEKGYAVQDVQGRTIGTVHAIDAKQKLLVLNTTHAQTVYH